MLHNAHLSFCFFLISQMNPDNLFMFQCLQLNWMYQPWGLGLIFQRDDNFIVWNRNAIYWYFSKTKVLVEWILQRPIQLAKLSRLHVVYLLILFSCLHLFPYVSAFLHNLFVLGWVVHPPQAFPTFCPLSSNAVVTSWQMTLSKITENPIATHICRKNILQLIFRWIFTWSLWLRKFNISRRTLFYLPKVILFSRGFGISCLKLYRCEVQNIWHLGCTFYATIFCNFSSY